MISNQRKILTKSILTTCNKNGWKIAIAESCTGGLLSGAITDISGSSAVFEGGFTTYSNAAKVKFLGVKKTTLENFGAVSKEMAIEMAKGVRNRLNCDIGISITGIAGPNNDGSPKPVGNVHISFSFKGKHTKHIEKYYKPSLDRETIRNLTIDDTLEFVLINLEKML